MPKKKNKIIWLAGFGLVAASFWAAAWAAGRVQTKKATGQFLAEQKKAESIPEVPAAPVKKTAGKESAPAPAPEALRLAVPFISQAPKKNWDVQHEDYCEEAALLMVEAFLNHKTYSVDQQETALAALYDWQMKNFGHFESTSVAEVVRLAREALKLKNVQVVENPTYEKIRELVAAGHPLIIPANGRALKNPFFKNGGPAFHMLVVRGFTKEGDFITNDPGTQHGENFVYKRAVLMNALHDWDGGPVSQKPASGQPRIIIIE